MLDTSLRFVHQESRALRTDRVAHCGSLGRAQDKASQDWATYSKPVADFAPTPALATQSLTHLSYSWGVTTVSVPRIE